MASARTSKSANFFENASRLCMISRSSAVGVRSMSTRATISAMAASNCRVALSASVLVVLPSVALASMVAIAASIR